MKNGWKILGGTARLALLLALILLGGLLLNGMLMAFALWKTANTAETPKLSEYSDALRNEGAGYVLPKELCDELDEKGCWAMLLSEDGDVVWQHGKPDGIAEHFTLAGVARMTRWYIADYPVRVWAHGDGLLVMASPKNSVWKYDVSIPLPTLLFWPLWLALTLVCNFLLIFVMSVGMTKRRYQLRDTARTEWIAAVSHDVRTPLSTVLGYASGLENDEALPEKERGEAALIRQKGEELRALISDLNLTNRLEHSMEPLSLVWLSPAALVREAAAEFLNAQSDEKYSIEAEISPGASRLLLRGDRALLSRMMKNLIGNSIRHNPQGCLITISLYEINGGRLELSVCDDGEGFSTEQLCRPAGNTAKPGHGLGLTIVRQIAAAHRARIRFFNRPGGGACCTVCFRRSRVKRTPYVKENTAGGDNAEDVI